LKGLITIKDMKNAKNIRKRVRCFRRLPWEGVGLTPDRMNGGGTGGAGLIPSLSTRRTGFFLRAGGGGRDKKAYGDMQVIGGNVATAKRRVI